ncbi:MAG: enoyl-CoA hydratase-related protein [Microscillaceae bacterium]|nr:enoyl-CoA hydratase-related protein [Microscillaceae bacterium]
MVEISKSGEPKLLVTMVNKIKTITINNPQAKNALSPETSAMLREAILVSTRDDTRVIILTGVGGNFCSGAALDASSMSNPKEYDVTQYLRETVNPAILGIRNINIPVIAKVRGVAVGLGANFALACDMVYASPDAVFSQIFTHIALSSDGGGAYFMPQTIGYKKAFEWMATAAKIPAEEALRYGMINHLVADEELDAKVQEMAETLARGPFVAIQQTKANLRVGVKGDLAATLETEAINQKNNFQTEDLIEGVMAFLQKRKPQFKGK